jgi:hypothetical protein
LDGGRVKRTERCSNSSHSRSRRSKRSGRSRRSKGWSKNKIELVLEKQPQQREERKRRNGTRCRGRRRRKRQETQPLVLDQQQQQKREEEKGCRQGGVGGAGQGEVMTLTPLMNSISSVSCTFWVNPSNTSVGSTWLSLAIHTLYNKYARAKDTYGGEWERRERQHDNKHLNLDI